MSDSLAKFVNDAVEFIGGGALFLASLAFFFYGWGWDPVHALHLATLSTLPTGLAAVIGVTVAYVAGIAAESLSRAMMEWDLHRISLRHRPFWQRELQGRFDPSSTVGFVSPAPGPVASWLEQRRGWYLGRYRSKDGGTGRYDREQLRDVLDVREFMRIKADVAGTGKDVTSQLKRLRLERMTLLSGILLSVGFLGRLVTGAHDWLTVRPLVISLVATWVLGLLVHVRFGRYCEAISRGYAMALAGPRPATPEPAEQVGSA